MIGLRSSDTRGSNPRSSTTTLRQHNTYQERTIDARIIMDMKRTVVIVTAALLLTGCSSPVQPAAEPEAGDNCHALTAGAEAALQAGLDAKGAGYTLETTTAIQDGDVWWVAARANGDPDVTGVWMTTQNPTTADDAAYTSATELASLISDYAMREDLTGSTIVNTAEACL